MEMETTTKELGALDFKKTELESMIIQVAWTCKNLLKIYHSTKFRRTHVHIANKYSCNIIEISEPQTLLEALK
jgi:hypothetical protein